MLTFDNPAALRPCDSGRQMAGTRSSLTGKMGLVSVVLLSGLLLAGCGRPGVRELFSGKRLLEQGRYAAAVEKLRAATTILTTNAQAFNYLGLACHQAGQLAEAEKAYRRALSLDQNLTEARYNLGCLFFAQNKLESAKGEFVAYTLHRPNDPQGWLKLGAAQVRARETAAAEKSLNEALKLNPHSPEALTSLGLTRVQRGRPSDGAQLFTRALNEQPGYRPALLNLAVVQQQYLQDRPTALQHYREYVSLKPVPEDAAAVQIVIRQLEQELAPPPRPGPATPVVQTSTNPPKSSVAEAPRIVKPAATNTVRNVLPAKPEPASAPALKSPSITAQPTRVTPASSPVADAAPSHVEVVQVPAEPVVRPAQDAPAAAGASVTAEPQPVRPAPEPTATAAKAQKRGLLQKLNPANLFSGDSAPAVRATPLPPATTGTTGAQPEAPALSSVARYAYRSPAKPAAGNRAQARRAFSEAVQAHQGQRLAEAIQGYRRAIQSDPSFFDAQYNLALAASQAGDLPLALASCENALAIKPESVDARFNFALALRQVKYLLDAANELERALTVSPNDSRCHLALGNLYAQELGQPAKARQHYLKLLELEPTNPQAGAVRYWLTDNPQ